MYPDSGYKMTHAQSVCTGPFSRGEGSGDEAKYILYSTVSLEHVHIMRARERDKPQCLVTMISVCHEHKASLMQSAV